MKMQKLIFQGILSFSTKILHLLLYLGLSIAILSLMFIPYAIISLINGHGMAGLVSLIITISLLGGLQLFIIGIIGLYIRYTFTQTEEHSSYIVKSTNMITRKC